MILVDTSIWIELFRNNNSKFKLDSVLLSQMSICPPVVQEVLQGVKKTESLVEFRVLLSGFPIVGNPVSIATYEHASHLYRLTRSKGRTIRSSIDCLVAAIAIEKNLPVWHKGRDFKYIAQISELEICSL